MSDETSASGAAGAPADPPSREARARSGVGLIGLIVAGLIGGGVAAVGVPRLAPLLPEPVGGFLTPPAATAQVDALSESVAGVRQVADTALSAVSGANDRLVALDGRIGELGAQVAALAARVEAQPGAGAAGDPDVAARLAALEQAAERLSADLAAAGSQGLDGAALARLERQVSELAASGGGGVPADVAERLAALESAHQEDVAARERAFAQADDARRAAAIATGLAAIDRAMTLGAPFAAELDALEQAAGAPAPAALEAVAAEGAWTREALKAAFPSAAHEAIEADLAAQADQGGAAAGVLARFRARVTGLPTDAIPGDSAPAVLSRARLDLLKGDLDAAVAAIEALPAPAQAAMAVWTEAAKLRSAADAALAAWRAELKLTL